MLIHLHITLKQPLLCAAALAIGNPFAFDPKSTFYSLFFPWLLAWWLSFQRHCFASGSLHDFCDM